MQFTISAGAVGPKFFLSDLFKSRGDDRHYLLVITTPRKNSRAYLPHEDTSTIFGFSLAGDIVLKWLNQPGRTAAELAAARSFFGWDITELSANQLQFIVDAEEAGLNVDFSYVPENSYGRTCPAVGRKDFSPS